MPKYTVVKLLGRCRLLRDLSPTEKRSRPPSSIILADGIAPSHCIAAVGVVLKSGRATSSPLRSVLSTRLLRTIESFGVIVSFVVIPLRPVHETSDPYFVTRVTALFMTPIKCLRAAHVCCHGLDKMREEHLDE